MKKIWSLFMSFIILFQILFPNFLYVEAANNATEQPEVCSGPSEMMSNYFNFQKEIKSVLLGSAVEEKRFNASGLKGGLFSGKVLKLPSALDVLASNVWGNTKSNISTLGTSAVLLLLLSASVLQSNTEGLAVLFKDRPIVRDYKQMLDIETDLFDVAYFRSKKINLLSKLDSKDLYQNLNDVIKKYQELGLFTGKTLSENESMADILLEMVSMNTYMKHFILYPGPNTLNQYYGCFGQFGQEQVCSEKNFVLMFDEKAIGQLKKDYSGLGMFGACNLYASNFKSSISKALNNNEKSIKQSFDDIKQATEKLKSALIGKNKEKNDDGSSWKKRNNRCDLSEYELAQLKAYWGPGWECGKSLETSFKVSKVREFLGNKKVQEEQNAKTTNVIDEMNNFDGNSNGISDIFRNLGSEDRRIKWYNIYGKDIYGKNVSYNNNFNFDMADAFYLANKELLSDYEQSYADASSSDISYELSKIKGLLDMVRVSIDSAEHLRATLKSISDYQCSQ